MIAFGTMIAPNFILTNRNVVEDHAVIAVRMASGDIWSARPILHDVPVDLVTLRRESTVEESSPKELISKELALDLTTGTTPILHVVPFGRRLLFQVGFPSRNRINLYQIGDAVTAFGVEASDLSSRAATSRGGGVLKLVYIQSIFRLR